MTSEAEHVRDQRLRWHCRRALLELDLVFQRFWSEQGDTPLSDDDALALEALLELEDHPLWALVSQPSLDVQMQGQKMLERLRRL